MRSTNILRNGDAENSVLFTTRSTPAALNDRLPQYPCGNIGGGPMTADGHAPDKRQKSRSSGAALSFVTVA
jgi:hypothetical protein